MAAGHCHIFNMAINRFQHTATRRWLPMTELSSLFAPRVSTHSHPKVAAWPFHRLRLEPFVSTHSHPKVAARHIVKNMIFLCKFQHTATRRWLLFNFLNFLVRKRFNTQPPEGGCSLHKKARKISKLNTVFR